MNKQLPQLYLLCEYCGTYFEYDGGKRRRWCTDKCKVAAWRKLQPVLTSEQKRLVRQTLFQGQPNSTIRFKNPKDKE